MEFTNFFILSVGHEKGMSWKMVLVVQNKLSTKQFIFAMKKIKKYYKKMFENFQESGQILDMERFERSWNFKS